MERIADLPTARTDRHLMFVTTENVQYFLPFDLPTARTDRHRMFVTTEHVHSFLPFLPLNRILGSSQQGTQCGRGSSFDHQICRPFRCSRRIAHDVLWAFWAQRSHVHAPI